jgi:hypothetical protein
MTTNELVRDMQTTVHRALNERLHLEDEHDLIERSDALLAMLPTMGGSDPTTALLLRRYHAELHAELCAGSQPRLRTDNAETELLELTRAVLVTMGGDEGLSIESAVLIGLVLLKRGLPAFCAMPATPPTMT